MARRRSPHRSEHAKLKTGVFLAFSLALFAGMYLLYGKLDRVWRGVVEIRVLFTQVKKLHAVAPVRYNGMELGRVKDVRIVHATPDLLSALPPLGADDLENLPLTEKERGNISLLPKDQIDAAARKAVNGRSMILATLTILYEQDDKRLRADDLYYVSSSYLGDSAVEIVTGKGPIVPARVGQMFLGVNADLISDIGKNMAQISEIMESMADVVGGAEKSGMVHAQLRNFDDTTALIEKNARAFNDELSATWDGIDARADSSQASMKDVIEKILGFKPEIEKALKKTNTSIEEIRSGLVDNVQDVSKYVVDYRKQALEQVAEWRKVSTDYKKSVPSQLKSFRSGSESALAAAAKLDDMLDRVEVQLKDSTENARIGTSAQSDAAMKLQETIWHFKNAPGSLNAKTTREQQAVKHADWRYDMVRKQYQELRRELAGMQNDLGVNDPADRERARHVEQLLSESDAYFGINRADYPAEILPPSLPGAEIRTGDPIPVPPPAETIELPKRKE